MKQLKQKATVGIAICAVMSVMAGNAVYAEGTDGTRTVVDMRGVTVELPEKLF